MSTNPSDCTGRTNRVFVSSDKAFPNLSGFPGEIPLMEGNFQHRYFVLQPIYKLNREIAGCEALFRNGWEDRFEGDGDLATRVMIDNWLLYGLEELAEAPTVFINCTRDSLLCGLLPLLPTHAVLEILEDVEIDDEVMRACRTLKSLGYRLCLDDFDGSAKVQRLVGLADFIKIDFRVADCRQRAVLLEGLAEANAQLVAEKIETEEEFCEAVQEGFSLFQGFYFPQYTCFMKSGDRLETRNCLQMLDLLQAPGFAVEALAECVDREPGVECRLLRRANWLTGPERPVNSTAEALVVVGKSELENLVTLALTTQGTFTDGTMPLDSSFTGMNPL